jgi:hypothetical protein
MSQPNNMTSNHIILNQSNWIGNTSSLEYRFPSQVKFETGDTISLVSMSMYNSMFNIEAVRNNNQVEFLWPMGDGTWTTYAWTIPNSFMSVSTLNTWLQQKMLTENLYFITSEGQAQYYYELITNPEQYSIQINAYRIPTTSEMNSQNLRYPSTHSWNCPTSSTNSYTPRLRFSAPFGQLIGFSAGEWPKTPSKADFLNMLSDIIPQIQPVYSIMLGCNLVSSEYNSQNVSIFYSASVNVGFGSLMDIVPNTPMDVPIRAGTYSSVRISLYDPNYDDLRLHDKELVLVLNLRKKIA